MRRTLALAWLLFGWTTLAVVIGGTWFAAGAFRLEPELTAISGVILAVCFTAAVCGVREIHRETSDE